MSADEELRLRDAISKRCPQHMQELDIGLNTGMRKGEQYSLEWSQVSFRRKRILLEETKNGSSREISGEQVQYRRDGSALRTGLTKVECASRSTEKT